MLLVTMDLILYLQPLHLMVVVMVGDLTMFQVALVVQVVEVEVGPHQFLVVLALLVKVAMAVLVLIRQAIWVAVVAAQAQSGRVLHLHQM
jgi:hypothetical protein